MKFIQKRRALSMVFLALNFCLFAQKSSHRCATMAMHAEQLRQNPTLQSQFDKHEQHTHQAVSRPQLRQRSGLINIPVVVHIVSRNNHPIENISDAQVLSQIEALNRDFRRQNTDQKNTPAEFSPVAADCTIEFQLAKRTPEGKATTGIVRHIKNRTLPFGKTRISNARI